MNFILEVDLDSAMDIPSNLDKLLRRVLMSMFENIPGDSMSAAFEENMPGRPKMCMISEIKGRNTAESSETPVLMRTGMIDEAFDKETWLTSENRGHVEVQDIMLRRKTNDNA